MHLKLVSWIDRTYNRVFHKRNCIRIVFAEKVYGYNDIVINGGGKMYLRCMGKNWYKIVEVYG